MKNFRQLMEDMQGTPSNDPQSTNPTELVQIPGYGRVTTTQAHQLAIIKLNDIIDLMNKEKKVPQHYFDFARDAYYAYLSTKPPQE